MVAERRSQMQIYVDILRLIQRKGGVAKPTHILYGANLSHARLNKHLGLLLDRQFVMQDIRSGHMVYALTPRGSQFIREFKKIEELSNAFGIPM